MRKLKSEIKNQKPETRPQKSRTAQPSPSPTPPPPPHIQFACDFH